jgi:hypothetical protein
MGTILKLGYSKNYVPSAPMHLVGYLKCLKKPCNCSTSVKSGRPFGNAEQQAVALAPVWRFYLGTKGTAMREKDCTGGKRQKSYHRDADGGGGCSPRELPLPEKDKGY